MAPESKGQIKASLNTKGRKGKFKKTITVETNDPSQSVISLTLLAIVEVELLTDPTTVYFKNMNKGEERLQKVILKNTSKNALQISSIIIHDKMIKVDLINQAPNWPIELKSDSSMELLVSFRYDTDNTRYSNQIKIDYSGGEANEAYFRVYATKEKPPEKPERQPETELENSEDSPKDTTPVSVKPKPSDKPVIQPPAKIHPDSQSKEIEEETQKLNE